MNNQQQEKISKNLLETMKRISPKKTITVIVLTSFHNRDAARLNQRIRMNRIRQNKEFGKKIREELAKLLADHNSGEILDYNFDTLGGIVVRANRKGIEKIAKHDDVSAILENQKIHIGANYKKPEDYLYT